MRKTTDDFSQYYAGNGIATELPDRALASTAPAALTLPDLFAPPEVVAGSAQMWWTQVALALLDAGIVRTRRIRAKEVNPARIAKDALGGMMDRCAGQLQCIGVRINLSDELETAVEFGFDLEDVAKTRQEPALLSDRPKCFLANRPDDWGFVRLQAALEALEGIAKGLGETLWHYLERWLYRIELNAYTPAACESDQVNYCWWGEDDETEVRGQYASDAEFAESGTLTRAEFDRRLPPWIVHPKRVLTQKAIREISRSTALGERERALLTLFFRAVRLFGKRRFDVFSPTGISSDSSDCIEQIAPSVFVRWNDDDPVTDVFDDKGNAYQQGSEGYFEGAMGFDCLLLDDPDMIRAWLPKAKRYFRAIGLLDRMLSTIEEYNQ
jgi:PRTRC genetic system protein F